MVDIHEAAWNYTVEIKRRTVGSTYPKEISELIAEKKKSKKNNNDLEILKIKIYLIDSPNYKN